MQAIARQAVRLCSQQRPLPLNSGYEPQVQHKSRLLSLVHTLHQGFLLHLSWNKRKLILPLSSGSNEQIFLFHPLIYSDRLCKIWGFHGGDYEECRLLWYKTKVHTSQETHYVSTTESSQLMLCKIWCFHISDYEECRLLGYKTPGPSSQETHYVSATESSQLILCKIWGFHGGDYEGCRLPVCYAV
jgi:hypothetical protein